MSFVKSIFLLLWVLLSPSFSPVKAVRDGEVFTEALLLKPLPDQKVLAHFHFHSSTPPTETYGRHHYIFPKSIYQMVQKFKIREMELSFTQGRWNYERWGGMDSISNANAKPPGVELWAEFDVPEYQVDESWKNLTHTLSGLFCASVNFLEDSTSYCAPQWNVSATSGKLRYGTLPREAVCTENLTPWLKLLPCRDKAGISSLMDRPAIYRSYFHSQRLRVKSDEFGSSETRTGLSLEQALTIVLMPDTLSGNLVPPSWSLSSLFGRKVGGICTLSSSSNVYVLFEQSLVSEASEMLENSEIFMDEGVSENPLFGFSVQPSKVIKGTQNLQEVPSFIYEFSLESYNESVPFDLGLRWKKPVSWSSQKTPLHASRFLTGSGNERGAIALLLKRNWDDHSGIIGFDADSCSIGVGVFQVVPWYVKVYYHTLQVFIDGKPTSSVHNIEKISVAPSEDKVSPGVMEIVLRLPCSVNTAALTLEFDKGFLHIDEYPPDANQGFDIPSAIVYFSNVVSNMSFGDNISKQVPLLSMLQENTPVRAYTEVLLVPLTTPDFSMPYNVITITCTVFALYFGSLLNVLRRRAGQEERLVKGKGVKKGPLTLLSRFSAKLRGKPMEETNSSSNSTASINYKLIAKVVVVVGVAIAWQYFSE